VRRLAVLAALPLVALAACGESRKEAAGTTGTTEKETTQAAGAVVATVKVSETEFKLDPENPKVAKSGVVAFEATNDGKITHALEVEGPKGEVRARPFAPGQSRTIKVDLPPGRYVWYCPIDGHKDKGMKGAIAVGR